LPDIHAAKGLYQQVIRGDAASALQDYEAGLRAAPNRSDLLGLASRAEAELGRSAAALFHRERAARLDPRSADVAAGLFNIYLGLRRYSEAQAALDRARALRPSSLSLLHDQAELHAAQGDLAGARKALALAHEVTDSTTVVAYVALREFLLWLLDDAQQRLVLTLTPADLDGSRADWALALAETYWRRGERRSARAYADTASVEYRAELQHVLNKGLRAQTIGLQALALAYLGRTQKAIDDGEEALNAAKRAAAPSGQRSYIQFLLARIYLLAEQPEKALDQLDQLAKTSDRGVTPGWLKIDPTFALLRGNPRFERLINGT
jgi:tetratricopeptide (TPR) repeat protein